MILADTSAWVDLLRDTRTDADLRLGELIETGGELVTTEPVILEVLVGARNDHEEARLRRLMQAFPLVPFDAASDFEGALRIYRRCRERGVTPRSLIDCMIAAVAMRARASVLASDADFARIASVVALELDPATPS